MESGQVVEFIDSQKIFCAVILDVKNMRLRLLTENNREVKLSAERLTHRSDRRLPAGLGRDKTVALLKELAAHRRELSRQVDIQSLWEVLHSEQQWIDLSTMTVFCFPESPNGDHESAVVRAFFNDRLYFKFRPDQFFPHSEERVAQIIALRRKEEHQARLIDKGGTWLQKVLKGQEAAPPQESDEIVGILASFYLHDKESPHRDMARAILDKAGAGAPSAVFTFLVRIGAWQPNENLDLLRYEIRTEMPEEVQKQAAAIDRSPPDVTGRRDLRDLDLMTIDGPGTLDFDDALSLVAQGDLFVLGIHIADVGHYIAKGDPIDQEALARGSSIYMPDQRISMLPSPLALDICSLKAGEDRPAISTLVTITPQAKIIGFEIVPTLIRVKRQTTYQDVDALVDHDEAVKALHGIAVNYRDSRLDDGALIIDLPEINIWLNNHGEPVVSRIDRESPSHLLVAELMILANSLAARFLSERKTPAVFRAQAEPRERLFERNRGSLYQNWMQRRQINRFILSSTPEPHAGLGVRAYVTCTSPIRKYSDLVTQRQLRAALGLEKPYSQAEIDFLIAALSEPMSIVGRIQMRRHRYWLLKYLESRIGSKLEAVVLNKRREGYVILIPEYLIECMLVGAENITLKPEDLIQVTVQHVNARNEVITVYLG
ncbi:MAG: RNB domain-containing ribonuclease [Desulfobacteraceae bacterium]|nr:MAG: RNB domain-containing ribonuclease [Desulfobacteraceae bacterium]